MRVYHGSNLTVEQPRLLPQNRYLDFGPGFYTTTNRNQAIEFSEKVVRREGGGIPCVSEYEFDENALSRSLDVLQFAAPDAKWLEFVSANRSGAYSGGLHDVVVGPVADDDVFTTVTLYLGGALTEAQALEALKVKRLFDQYVWKTEAALKLLSFTGSFESEGRGA